ncbi:MAG: SsrA-binding protein SmpB [Deltaproteobacteria bacterium]|nr:SsrA-binding protein SmpB [Deltaproteobacteria bacterium]
MGIKIITKNKKALFNYHVVERFEAGVMLTGSEVKSVRDGKINLVDAYATIRNGEVFLHKANISPYPPAAGLNHEPTRVRKLLLHRHEIEQLTGALTQKGFTLIPLSVYFKEGKAKVELGLAHGKKQHDKRADMKKREANRTIERALRSKNR